MSPEKMVKAIASQLMVVFKEAGTQAPSETQAMSAHSFIRAPSGKSFFIYAKSCEALQRCAEKMSVYLDGYPAKKCEERLRSIAIAEKDAGTPISEVCNRMAVQVHSFIQEFQNQGQWEVVYATRGIDPEPGPFRIGSCHFYHMDGQAFATWGQRYECGQYEPPDNTVVSTRWIDDELSMRGQFVAAVRIRAIDQEHARTKGRHRIQEAINVLHYGQLATGFQSIVRPEIGIWTRQHLHDHSFAFQIDAPNCGTHRSLGGQEGVWQSFCKNARGWSGLENVIVSDLSARSEMQLRITNALEWIGQAAMANSTSVRLVALFTALEALLINEGESLGKKAKLSKRISRLIASSDQESAEIAEEVADLYRTRSECVHGGGIDVGGLESQKTVRLLERTFEAIVSTPPYSTDSSLQDILNRIDPPASSASNERDLWVSENAFLRWVDEGCPNNRQLQHWLDAEREYLLKDNWFPRTAQSPD